MRIASILLGALIVAGCASETKPVAKTADSKQAFFEHCREATRGARCGITESKILKENTVTTVQTLSFVKEVGRDSLWSCSKQGAMETLTNANMPEIEFDGEWLKGRPSALGDFKCAYLVCNEEVCQESGDEMAQNELRRNAMALDKVPGADDVSREELYECLHGKMDPATTMACGGVVNLPTDKVIHYFTKSEIAQAKTIYLKNSEKLNKDSLQECMAVGGRKRNFPSQSLPEQPLKLQLESIRCEGGALAGWASMLSARLEQKTGTATLVINGKTKTLDQVQTMTMPAGLGRPATSHEKYKIEKRINGFYFAASEVSAGENSDYNTPLCFAYQGKGDEVLISRVGKEGITDCTNGGTSVWKYKVVK